MVNRNFVKDTMNKISAIDEYKEKYGEEDITAYYNAHGTYAGIEEYLKERISERES